MPGHIIDPNLNGSGDVAKEYGFLMNAVDGHIYMYLKDKDSQFYTHGTPVNFVDPPELRKIQDKGKKKLVKILVYTKITADSSLGSYEVVKRMNEFAQNITNGDEDMDEKSKKVKAHVKKF